MVNFQKLTSGVGGYLTSTSVLTDSTGVAESTFIVNSSDFDNLEQLIQILRFFYKKDQRLRKTKIKLFYFGSQYPEIDVEFEYYPDSDTINHALYETTNISVMAKNDSGVGVSNVLSDLNQMKQPDVLKN